MDVEVLRYMTERNECKRATHTTTMTIFFLVGRSGRLVSRRLACLLDKGQKTVKRIGRRSTLR